MNSLSIYVHFPFCSGKCAYCDFYSKPSVCGTDLDTYTDAVIAHIRQKSPSFRHRTVVTVYFGGGTPSILGARNLCRVLDAIRTDFTLSADCEITTEANPGDIYLDTDPNPDSRTAALQLLRSSGFNRISFGVQSSNDEELRTLGRRHNFKKAVEAVLDAKSAGFDNLTLDLMYGLPGQTDETWQKSLSDIVALAPAHISCYALRLEEGTPLYARLADLPDDDTVSDRYLAAVEFLVQHGYQQYEVSNYAKPGCESRHNSRYWIGGNYLSFGPAAHSYLDGVRYAYTSDTSSYIAAVNAGQEPAYSEYTVLTQKDQLEEAIMLRLRTASGLDPDILTAQFGIDTDSIEQKLRRYVKHGLCKTDGRIFSLTPEGMFVQNSIILDILDEII